MAKYSYTNLIISKLDNGFKGFILDWDDAKAVALGRELFNRQLKAFPAGTLLYAIVHVTPTGRRTIKKVWRKMSPITETTLLRVRLAGIYGALNIEETKALRAAGAVVDKVDEFKPIEDVYGFPAPEPEPEEIPVKPSSSSGSGYHVSEDARLVFTTAKVMSDARPEKAVKIMMVGPSGYGKTTMPKLFAELTGKKFMRMNCATVRDPEEWFGYREALDGSTVFIRSQFARALQEGNLVVVLDEFNRLEPWLHNTLFPLLDDDGCTVVHDEKFSIGPNVIVVGTINTGYKYTGTFELDEALSNRFDFFVEVGPLAFEDEVRVLTKRTTLKRSDADKVVKTATVLRSMDIGCSTRSTLLIAQMVTSGLTLREAFESAIIRRIPVDSSGNGLRKQVVDAVNVRLGALKERRLTNDVFASLDEEVKVEVKTKVDVKEGRAASFSFTHDKSKELLLMNFIRLLRNLPVAVEGDRLSLLEAKTIAEQVRDGLTTYVMLSRPLDEDVLNETIVELKRIGLSGKYSPS